MTAGAEGANAGSATRNGGVRDVREDRDDDGGIAGAVADNTLIRLSGYDGAYGGGFVSDGERRAGTQGMS